MQGTAERRAKIMKILCRRRNETIANLANELGVSDRTIRRDIDILSLEEPIYTQQGRHGGGVYIVEDYTIDRMYMNDFEINVLQKLANHIKETGIDILTGAEAKTLDVIISQYKKPNSKRR